MKPERVTSKVSAVEQKAVELAISLETGQSPPGLLEILRNLDDLPEWLERTRKYCSDPNPDYTRAADWLLDNDYQIMRAVREVRADMPAEFYRRLPAQKQQDGQSPPRIFVIAHAMLESTRFQLTVLALVEFLQAYQETTPLAIAELWALPSMLRLASLEILSTAFGEIDDSLQLRFNPIQIAEVSSPDSKTDRIWRAISILIAVQSIEWRDVVDQTSRIEALLKTDPSGVYAKMDFETRDRYRKVVEELARGSATTEIAVAEAALDLALDQQEKAREGHVGYWLIDKGRNYIEIQLDYRLTMGDRVLRKVFSHAGKLYGAALLLFVFGALVLPISYILASGGSYLALLGGVLLSLLPVTVLSIAFLHWIITRLTQPWVLPMMDFRKGIPADCLTCVAVPIIITREEEISRLVDQMEIRYLENPDPMLRFVLLSDHADAPSEHMPSDEAISNRLAEAIRILNRRHGRRKNTPFYLLHRPREYNPSESSWIGWERKRGKLEQFNAFLLGGTSDPFSITEGNIEQLQGCRSVITLDADTSLPLGSAARLVGAMAHPLNKAVIDPQERMVVAGYTVIQPRIEVLPLKGPVSLFCRLFAGDTAFDIYSRAVSDVYQDMFGTGIYVGKGIYDVAAFHTCLQGRVPENKILSHDLFEGLHGKVALASNIVLYEDFPATYVEYAIRLHRWVRGDWQLLGWLRRTIPSGEGQYVANTFTGLDRWKIVDNLRRSLLAPALLLFFIGGWMALPGSAWLWTALAVAAPGAYLVGEIHSIVTAEYRGGYFGDFVTRLGGRLGRWFLIIAFLVSDTLMSLDAIFRTLWRMMVSGRHLLEWRSAAYVSASMKDASNRSSTWSMMWPSTAFAAVLGLDLALYDKDALLPAAPILLLWMIAPEIAIWIGRPRPPRREMLGVDERLFLNRIARQTWLYFETFAGPEDNWLPPDNFQESPKGEIAHRTSPTNIGLFLTSAQAAHDFGFSGTSEFSSRIRNVLASVERMESYRGHILNWYDTRTLSPLEPRYVSTVDSGNLAVCLMALRQGCKEVVEGPAIKPGIWDGLASVLDLLLESIDSIGEVKNEALERSHAKFRNSIDCARDGSTGWHSVIDEIANHHWPDFECFVADTIGNSQVMAETKITGVHAWNERVHHHIHALIREIDIYLPWLRVASTVPEGMQSVADEILMALPPTMEMNQLTKFRATAKAALRNARKLSGKTEAQQKWCDELSDAIAAGISAQQLLRKDLLALSSRADILANRMDFRMLYNPEVRLFRIGYNVSTGQMDPNHYDLLATEARLASYFAISKHDVPVEHWFSLGRPVTRLRGKPSVLSWNGSMFEYLMPPIFLPGQRDTLLGESESTAVVYQRAYARMHGVPWGISESAFATTDSEGNYQYRAFGAPGLALRRGLTEDLVISPYASALALCCWPNAAVRNLEELRKLGALGTYGYYDAVDFTRNRVAEGRDYTIVRNYMAHHHGMTLGAIANVLDNDVFVRRVLSGKRMQAIELLLQEQVPWDVQIEKGRIAEGHHAAEKEHSIVALAPWIPSSAAMIPQMHMLGNGSMGSWISESGAGGLFRQDFSLTRWLPDSSCDSFGYWIYIRDADSGETWSVGRLPTGKECDHSRVVFHQHMVEMFRRDYGIAVRMEAVVSSADDADIRELTVTNESDVERVIEFTSFAEVVLAPPLDDERHPAFSKLFVGSTYLEDREALLFTRRPRRPEIKPPVLLHRIVHDDPDVSVSGYETDRKHFIGRSGNLSSPAALLSGLSQSTGWTLDPCMALQTVLRFRAGEEKHFAFVTIAGESEGEVLEIADRHASLALQWSRSNADRSARREINRLEIDPVHLPALQLLSSLLLMPHPEMREMPLTITANKVGQPDLWQFGISGDFPILLLHIDGEVPTQLLELLIKAQMLWRNRGMRMDLVVVRNESAGYEAPLRERILAIIRDMDAFSSLGTVGGIHLISAGNMDRDVISRLNAAAHVVLHDDEVPLVPKLDRILEHRAAPPQFRPTGDLAYLELDDVRRREDLVFGNGTGGFEPESGDYIIHLDPGQTTPAPWCNILANYDFGTIVSESGLGFTWAINSGENRLTPWSNDPVCNTPGEALYLRDEQTGDIWTPTPMPAGDNHACQITHSAGCTNWIRRCHGLAQTLCAFVPSDDPVKIVTLKLHNHTTEHRRITATYFAEWLLGALASRAKSHTVCEYDASIQAILANNAWNPVFGDRVAFLTSTLPPHSVTGSRSDFLSREGAAALPAGLRHSDLGGRFGADGETCAAYQVHLDMAPGMEVEVSFMLGQGSNPAETQKLVEKWKDKKVIGNALADVEAAWEKRLGAVNVRTPDPAFDLMINRWLVYQNVSSRLMARGAFYQAGGAFGYRDQLQDVLALLMIEPKRAREQILLAAARQFEEGDALHWWHPPSGQGVRTHCSDDYLWLAFVTARYVEATGEFAILNEKAPFLSGPLLRVDEHDRYGLFETGMTATLMEHCERALGRMMVTGVHGLPLMGTGDWNDGMDRVGDEGRGESVWLAWFQIATIDRFLPILKRYQNEDLIEQLNDYAARLKEAVNDQAWDGAWFIRAFDDDNEPWGSRWNEECQIDAIAQSWSVISRGASDIQQKTAMESVRSRLILDKERIVQVLDPPFNATLRDPGYIRAYPPGIRENGGQYTHAAAWTGHAYAGLGDGDTAWQVFDIINPIRRTQSSNGVNTYAREPYVLPGDVYGPGQNAGLGGWSWYTGAAGWTWSLGVEAILGLRLINGALSIDPCLPREWSRAEATISGPRGKIEITIEDSEKLDRGKLRFRVDGKLRRTSRPIGFPGRGKIRRVTASISRKSRG